jgi:hypothetical protein
MYGQTVVCPFNKSAFKSATVRRLAVPNFKAFKVLILLIPTHHTAIAVVNS